MAEPRSNERWLCARWGRVQAVRDLLSLQRSFQCQQQQIPRFARNDNSRDELSAKRCWSSGSAPYNRTVVNANHTPQRVVSLQPSATVTLRDLGLLDRLVACTKYCVDVCPEVGDGSRLIVSDSWTAQTEQILAARPDLVLASVPYQLEAVAAILKAGVRFLGLAPRRLAEIYTDMAAIAGVMGVWDTGQSVITTMQNEIEAIRKRTCPASKAKATPTGSRRSPSAAEAGLTLRHYGRPKGRPLPETRRKQSFPKVFCEEWGKPIIASQPWVAELVEAAGGEFLAEPGKTTTAEEVASAQPDAIVAAWCGAGDRVPLEKVVEQRAWGELPAVRQGRVFCISDELLNTPATSLLGGLRALAWALHPEMFPRPAGIRQLHCL